MTNRRGRIAILAVGALALLGAWALFAVASGSNAFADEPDKDPAERVKTMIAKHRSVNHVKFSANDKVSIPDDPKGSVSYRLESYDYDEENQEWKVTKVGTASVALPVTDDQKPVNIVDDGDLAVYSGSSYDVAVNAAENGFAAYIGIYDADAPTTYEFGYTLPAGFKLTEVGDGSIRTVDNHGRVTGTIGTPWTYDADGGAVNTKYTLSNGALVQTIAHEGAAYPVVADPSWSFGFRWVIAQYGLFDGEEEFCLETTYENESRCATAYGTHGETVMASAFLTYFATGSHDPIDAYRHCYWAARKTMDMGHSEAAFFGNLHEEEDPDNTVAAERMDQHNNAVGRGLGLTASSYLSARLTCQGWAADPAGPLQLNLNDYHRFQESPL